MWKPLPKGSYALGVESEPPAYRGQHESSRKCCQLLPCGSSSSSVSSGEVLFTLTSEFTPCFPQIAWLEQASPNHWPSQPGSSERSLSCLLSTPIPLQGGSELAALPTLWKHVLARVGCVASWWHMAQPSARCGPGLKVLSSLLSLYPLTPPGTKSFLFLQQALSSHLWYS